MKLRAIAAEDEARVARGEPVMDAVERRAFLTKIREAKKAGVSLVA
jgi:hypothetical protein